MCDTRSIINSLNRHELFPTIIRHPDGKFETILTHNPGSLRYKAQMRLASMFTPGKSKHTGKKHNNGKPLKTE